MANEIIHVTSKLQDDVVVTLLTGISEAFDQNINHYRYGIITVSPDEIEELIGDGNGYLIEEGHITLDGHNLQVIFRRGKSAVNNNGQVLIGNRIPSPYFDEVIVVTSSNPASTIEDCRTVESIIADHIELHIPDSVQSDADGAIQLLQKEMGALTKFHRKMLSDAEKQRLDLETEYNRRQKLLEEKSETDRKKLEEEANSKKQELEDIREELEKAKSEIDDRDHMHVRRQLREQITDGIKEDLSKTLIPGTSAIKGNLIFFLSILAAIAAGVFAYENMAALYFLLRPESALNTSANPTTQPNLLIWLYTVRGTFLSIVSLGLFIYALSWLRKTYLDDVGVSHDLKRYAMDINRASWTIETIMEMTTKEGRVLPDKWIDGVCYGLFRGGKGEKTEMTALDAWGKLLGVSGKAELGPEGPKLQFNKRDTSKIVKSSKTQTND